MAQRGIASAFCVSDRNSNAELSDDLITPWQTAETGMQLWGDICHKWTQPHSVFKRQAITQLKQYDSTQQEPRMGVGTS